MEPILTNFYAFINREQYIQAHLTNQKFTNKAIIFIPSFCIAEVRNLLGKYLYRKKGVFTKQQYEKSFETFISHVHDRKFFYSYDLNRYHNINTSDIIKVEHTTNTEFDASGLPIGTSSEEIRKKLAEKHKNNVIGYYYLSTFDILIIAMGIELKRIHGDEIHLLTGDKRLFEIASQKPTIFPKPYYWKGLSLKVSDLPK